MKKYCIYLIILAFAPFLTQGQVTRYIAQDYQDEYRYADAITFYQKAIDKKPSAENYAGLAECYQVLREYVKAERYYAKAFKENKKDASVAFNYGLMLKANGKYEEAKIIFVNYQKIGGDSLLADAQIRGCDLVKNFTKNEGQRTILKNLESINSRYSEFGLTPIPNKNAQFLFSSNKKKRGVSDEMLAKEILKPYYSILQLEQAQNEEDVDRIQASSFSSTYDYHVATPSFSQNGDTVFFTKTVISQEFKEKLNRLEIHFAVKDSNGWQDPQPFIHNLPSYSHAHPWLNEKGDVLYFISNRPGGFGAYDIYVSRHKEGIWQAPVNLGANINTSLDEFYPVYQNHRLVFASAGLPGIGGLDLFESKRQNQQFGPAKNLGLPYNSSADDFSLIAIDDMRYHFSSNRDGGKGSDDIYYLEEIVELPLTQLFVVSPFNGNTPLNLSETEMLIRTGNGIDAEVYSKDGEAYYILNPGEAYYAAVEKEGYLTEKIPLNFNQATVLDTIVIQEGNPLQRGLIQDVRIALKANIVGKEFEVSNIYYDYNKADIRPEAAVELDALVDILKENPELTIELGSHCDSRGDDAYNQALSERRAKSAVDYISGQGIDKQRLLYKGYGESKLVNDCANGVQCSEEQHQENRRTVFKIMDNTKS